MKSSIFGLKVSIVLVVAILAMMNAAAAGTAYAHHDDKSSNSMDNSKPSDNSKSSDNTKPQTTSLQGGDNNNSPPQQNNIQPSQNPPNNVQPPQNPPPSTPSGANGPTNASPQCTGNDVTQCPNPNGNLGTNCPQGATVVNGHCVVQGPPLPTPMLCPDGKTTIIAGETCPHTPNCPQGILGVINTGAKCVNPLPHNCKSFNNMTNIVCVIHRTVVHNSHSTIIQQIPILAGTNNVDLFIVTQCITDFDNNQIKGTTATICDTSLAMMHANGLDTQIPQIDQYLKERNLL